MPVGIGEREVHQGNVGPDAFDFLGKPQGECVVVPRGNQDPVGFHRLEQIDREVVGGGFVGPAGGLPVGQERHQSDRQHRKPGQPLSKPAGHLAGRDPEPCCHQGAEERERSHEEVVALAHLPHGVGVDLRPVGIGEAVLEVEIEHQRHGEGQQHGGGGDPGPAVGLHQPPEPGQPGYREQRGKQTPEHRRPVPGELPAEILPVVPQLVEEQRRVPRFGVGIPGLHEHRGLLVLDPVEDVHQRLAEEADRLPLVDRGELGRPDREEHVVQRDPHQDREDPQVEQRVPGFPDQAPAQEAQGYQDHQNRPQRKPIGSRPRPEEPGQSFLPGARYRQEEEPSHYHGPGAGYDSPVGPQHVNRQGRGRKHPHHVVGGIERDHVGDQHQPAVPVGAGTVVAPVDRQPGGQGHPEQRDGVDLLVHGRLVPDRPGERPDQYPRHRGAEPEDPVLHQIPEPALGHQEPEPRCQRAGDRGEQVDPDRVGRRQGNEAPYVSQHHKQRIAGRVGNSQGLGGCDVLRGIPEGGGGSQSDQVDHKDRAGRQGGEAVGRRLGGFAGIHWDQCRNIRRPVVTIAMP